MFLYLLTERMKKRMKKRRKQQIRRNPPRMRSGPRQALGCLLSTYWVTDSCHPGQLLS